MTEITEQLNRIESAVLENASPYVSTDIAAARYAAIRSVKTWRAWRDSKGIRNIGEGGVRTYVKAYIRKAREGGR